MRSLLEDRASAYGAHLQPGNLAIDETSQATADVPTAVVEMAAAPAVVLVASLLFLQSLLPL